MINKLWYRIFYGFQFYYNVFTDQEKETILDDAKFYFCGRSSLKDFSYCKLHLLYAFQPKGKKEDVTEKEEVPEFLEKKIKSA